MAFSDDERRFLQTVCRFFHEQAQWPTMDYLDRALTQADEDFDVVAVAAQLESSLFEGWYPPIRGWEAERTIPLTITTLYTCYTDDLCPELGDDFDAFMQVLRLAVDKYRTRTNDRPEVTSDEVQERFVLSALMLRKVFDLVSRAGLTFGSSSRDAGPDQPLWWSFTIARDVRHYRQATTIADFIRIRERVRETQRQQYQAAVAPPTAETVTLDAADRSGAEAAATAVSVQLRPISLFPPGPFTRNEYLCFVLMPFAKKLRPVYDAAIKPAATQVGLECVRADEIYKPGGIMQQVWQNLMTARVVVADLTDRNANVFYELGLAHTIGHDVILLTQDMKWVPFDLQHMRCIQYQLDEHGLRLLTQELGQMLRTVLAEPVG